MSILRSLKILEQIHMLFDESDFALTTGGRKSKHKQDKLKIALNLNGTVTVAAPRINGDAIFITFDGSDMVEIWDGGICGEIFRLGDASCDREEMRRSFRTKLEKEYGFEFKSGGHQPIRSDYKFTFLPTACIIPQFFQVFHEGDLDLMMSYRNPYTGCRDMDYRFAGGISLDGNIIVRAHIEMLTEGMSPKEWVTIVFDGSGEAKIIDQYRTDTVAVLISDARRVLIEEYGVSFEKEWQEPISSIFL